MSATALNFIDPLPFKIASFIVGVSTINPPVGKSGPLIIFKKSLGFASLFAIAYLTASVI